MVLPTAITQNPFEDFLSDPVLTVACVLLILVAFFWILTARVIAHNQKMPERRARRYRPRHSIRPSGKK